MHGLLGHSRKRCARARVCERRYYVNDTRMARDAAQGFSYVFNVCANTPNPSNSSSGTTAAIPALNVNGGPAAPAWQLQYMNSAGMSKYADSLGADLTSPSVVLQWEAFGALRRPCSSSGISARARQSIVCHPRILPSSSDVLNPTVGVILQYSGGYASGCPTATGRYFQIAALCSTRSIPLA